MSAIAVGGLIAFKIGGDVQPGCIKRIRAVRPGQLGDRIQIEDCLLIALPIHLPLPKRQAVCGGVQIAAGNGEDFILELLTS